MTAKGHMLAGKQRSRWQPDRTISFELSDEIEDRIVPSTTGSAAVIGLDPLHLILTVSPVSDTTTGDEEIDSRRGHDHGLQRCSLDAAYSTDARRCAVALRGRSRLLPPGTNRVMPSASGPAWPVSGTAQ